MVVGEKTEAFHSSSVLIKSNHAIELAQWKKKKTGLTMESTAFPTEVGERG